MKLLLIGPSKAGKSVLASFLAGMLDSTTPAAEPPPTVGVRILEFTCAGAAIELWDVSGDQSYENTWPAVQQGADGVVMCYCPETPGHAVRRERCAAAARAFQLTRAAGARCRLSRAQPPLTHTKHCTALRCTCTALAEGAGAVLRVVLRQAQRAGRALRVLCAVAVWRGRRHRGRQRHWRRAAREVSAARRRRRGCAARL